MRLDFTGRQMEITPDLREYTKKHLSKLTRVLRDRFDVHAILTAEKHRRIAELTLKCRDHVLVGVQQSGDILVSINGAIDKLERQAVRLTQCSGASAWTTRNTRYLKGNGSPSSP